jgi:protoporphyrinogen oxidase
LEKHRVAVLGGGLTGLSFAYHFGSPVPVLEKADFLGGLVRTECVDGRFYDFAPHLFHIGNEYTKELLFNELNLDMDSHTRNSGIYCDEKIVPYPFEFHLNLLSEKLKRECIEGLDSVLSHTPEQLSEIKMGSYYDYALKSFGPGILKHYLGPYNKKIWDIDPREMTCDWIRKLPTADVEKIKKCAQEGFNGSFGYNVEFYYPKERGIGEIPEAFARNLTDIRLNHEVVAIDPQSKIVKFSSGSSIQYEKLLSTIPLKELVELTGMSDLIQTSQNLKWTSIYVVNVVITGRLPESVHWLYFPSEEQSFYRMTFPNQFFGNCCRKNEAIISVEVGSQNGHLNIDEMSDRVLAEIKQLDFLEIDQVVTVHNMKIPYGYCIFDFNRRQIVPKILEQLEQLGIFSVGRYGAWDYTSMEDAILDGREFAQRFINEG